MVGEMNYSGHNHNNCEFEVLIECAEEQRMSHLMLTSMKRVTLD